MWWKAASVLPSESRTSIGGASGCTNGVGPGALRVRPSSSLREVHSLPVGVRNSVKTWPPPRLMGRPSSMRFNPGTNPRVLMMFSV
jgi:hypothetical protein